VIRSQEGYKLATFLGFQTLDELTNYYYGRSPNEILKADGFGTGVEGGYNAIFGAIAWANFNLEANVFAALPKFVWDYSGARIFTAKADNLKSVRTQNDTFETPTESADDADDWSKRGGTVEGGAIARSVRPAIEEIRFKPKTIQYPFEVSELHEHLVESSRDDLFGSLAHQRLYAADQMKENMNQMLVYNSRKVVGAGSSDSIRKTDYETQVRENSYELQTLYSIISSKAEYDAYVADETLNAAKAGKIQGMNVWHGASDLNRSSAKQYDSTVTSPLGSSKDELKKDQADVLLNSTFTDTLADIRTASGKEPTLLVGGQDTYSEIQKIYFDSVRIPNTADVRTEFSVTVGGIETFTGTGAGLHLSTVYGLPFIPTKDAPKNDNTYAGDLFILNTSADKMSPNKPLLGIQTLSPVLYYEASKRQQGWPFINDAYVDRAIYKMLAECTCRNFKAQGKIINIKKGN